TGVQTCALPIWARALPPRRRGPRLVTPPSARDAERRGGQHATGVRRVRLARRGPGTRQPTRPARDPRGRGGDPGAARRGGARGGAPPPLHLDRDVARRAPTGGGP